MSASRQIITDEERLKLAAKLDQDLDEFIGNLPKREKQETVSLDRWEEEVTSHPFFIKEIPEDVEKLHPLYEGLQKLKYDPDENEPEELAIAYKDDGNFHFKHKKYRMAIISYTEGIKVKCGNADIDANLYNNRSASHYFLKNYRSALIDAENGLKLKRDYDKLLYRAANCCIQLRKFDNAVEYCDKILYKIKDDPVAIKLRIKSINEAKVLARNKRKKEMSERKLHKEADMIVNEILKRGIKIEGGTNNLTLSRLEPQFPGLINSRVTLTTDGGLLWPVVFFYPEYKIMDYIQQFYEQNTFSEQLACVFSEFPEWDQNKDYMPQNLNVYFENENTRNVKIDVNQKLFDVLKLDGHIIKEGTPKFIIVVANSDVEKSFLEHS